MIKYGCDVVHSTGEDGKTLCGKQVDPSTKIAECLHSTQGVVCPECEKMSIKKIVSES